MTQNERLQHATSLYALAHLMSEHLENLRGTDLFKQKRKNLYNQLQKDCDILINGIYQCSGDHAAKEYHEVIDILDLFIQSLNSNGLDKTLAVIKELNKGKIMVLPEGKEDIMEQLNTL